MKKLDVSGYSLAHFTRVLLLHYFVNFWRHSLAVCNNECVGSKHEEQLLSLRKSFVLHHINLLKHVLKMSSFSTNASSGRWHDSPTARPITRDPEQLSRCWCVISVRRRTILKWTRQMLNINRFSMVLLSQWFLSRCMYEFIVVNGQTTTSAFHKVA